MLTNTEYANLWTYPAPNGFAQPMATLPPYDYYVIRENQYQDYLDIFRGHNTRGVRIAPHGGWYYNHPFFNDNGPVYQIPEANPKIPQIQYFLIGEAARPLGINNTYFYDINHGTSKYFTAPCSAFNVAEFDIKAERLFNLAMQGVVLIDIFPFAINYNDNDFRNFLNNHAITEQFWSGLPHSVGDRIAALMGLMAENQRLAFIAPPTISHHIAEHINHGHWPNFGSTVRDGVNQLIQPIIPVGPPYGQYIEHIHAGTQLIGLLGINYFLPLNQNNGFAIKVPTYACCCYSGARTVPHQLFIRNAFGLP